MADQIAPRHAPDDLNSVSVALADGTVRTLTPKDGLVHPKTAEEDAALESLGWARAEGPKAKKALKRPVRRLPPEPQEPITVEPSGGELDETKGAD